MILSETEKRQKNIAELLKVAAHRGNLHVKACGDCDMEKMLMTSQELAQAFAADIRTAKAWCLAHGIEPINIGTGAKKHLRWNRAEVESALCTRREHSNSSSSSSAKPAQTTKHGLLGKSIKELMGTLAAQAAA